MTNKVVAASITTRVQLEVERVLDPSQPIGLIVPGPEGTGFDLRFQKGKMTVGFETDGQHYRFNLSEVVAAFRSVLSVDPPSHIGDSAGQS